MAFLDGLIKAGLYGATGFMAGRADRDARQRAEAEKAAERERQAQEDALRAALMKAQTEAESALTIQRRTPDAPPVRNIDPLSQEGITAAGQRAAAIERARQRYQAKTGGLTPGQQSAVTDDEAEGLGILNTMKRAPAIQADTFFKAWDAARKSLPTLSPGRLSLRVYQGLRRARPDLFTDGAGGGAGNTFGFPGTGTSGSGGGLIRPGYTGDTGYSPEADSMVDAHRAAQANAPPAPAASTSARRPLTPEEKQAAATDAGFRAFLQQKGYTPRDWQ